MRAFIFATLLPLFGCVASSGVGVGPPTMNINPTIVIQVERVDECGEDRK